MAIDQTTETQELTAFDTLDIGFGEKPPEEPPYLAIFTVDTRKPDLYKPGREQWVIGWRPVTWQLHNASGQIFQYLSGSSKANSKFMTFYEAVSQYVPELKQKGAKVGTGGLVGEVCWMQKKHVGKGQYAFDVTVPVKRATAEEKAQARALPPLPENPGQPAPVGQAAADFEWTEERIQRAVKIIAGKNEAQKTVAAMQIEDDDQLRSMITSDKATEYLLANGHLIEGEDGSLALAS